MPSVRRSSISSTRSNGEKQRRNSTSERGNNVGNAHQQIPQVNVNGGKPPQQHQQRQGGSSRQQQHKSPNSEQQQAASSSRGAAEAESSAWGANFWVTLVEPQSQTPFYACPATGQVSWDPPVGNFVLPPSPDGEWWELIDESRGGLPYYYHTKTNETVWERPADAFVIPLAILQNTAACKRLSVRYSQAIDPEMLKAYEQHQAKQQQLSNNSGRPGSVRRSMSDNRLPQSNGASASAAGGSTNGYQAHSTPKRSVSDLPSGSHRHLGPGHAFGHGQKLPPIPGSPYQTEDSTPPSPKSKSSSARARELQAREKQRERDKEQDGSLRSKSSGKSRPPQSLDAAASRIAHETTPPRKKALSSPTGTKSNKNNGSSAPPTPVSPIFSNSNSNNAAFDADGGVGGGGDGDLTLPADMTFAPQASSSPSRTGSSLGSRGASPILPHPSSFSLNGGAPNLSIKTERGLLDVSKNGNGRMGNLPTPTSPMPTPLSPTSLLTTSSMATSQSQFSSA